MLAPNAAPMGADEFLRWVGTQSERHELVRGVPVRLMAGAKQSHNVVVGNLADTMRRGAKAAGCRTTSSDTAVIGAAGNVRYPDIVVDCGPADPDALAAAKPVIVVEVLSPTTSPIDFSDKLDEYRANPSIDVILLIDPDVVSVKAYRRRVDGEGWSSERHDDPDSVLRLPAIATDVGLAEIYDTLTPKRLPRMTVVSSGDAAG